MLILPLRNDDRGNSWPVLKATVADFEPDLLIAWTCR